MSLHRLIALTLTEVKGSRGDIRLHNKLMLIWPQLNSLYKRSAQQGQGLSLWWLKVWFSDWTNANQDVFALPAFRLALAAPLGRLHATGPAAACV